MKDLLPEPRAFLFQCGPLHAGPCLDRSPKQITREEKEGAGDPGPAPGYTRAQEGLPRREDEEDNLQNQRQPGSLRNFPEQIHVEHPEQARRPARLY